MANGITEIFQKAADVDQFRRSVISLEGDFPFDSVSMIDLGNAYFDRYPDRFSNRNTQEVLLGYALVRICAVERMIRNIDRARKDAYRTLFADVSRAAEIVSGIVRGAGKETALQEYRLLAEELQLVKDTVDEIPRGMVKERYIGGISNLFNILYVLKMNVDKSPGS